MLCQAIFAAHKPYATWEYIKRISAAILTLQKLKDHIKRDFNHFHQGKLHTSPGYQADIEELLKIVVKNKVHVYEHGRIIKKTNKRGKQNYSSTRRKKWSDRGGQILDPISE